MFHTESLAEYRATSPDLDVTFPDWRKHLNDRRIFLRFDQKCGFAFVKRIYRPVLFCMTILLSLDSTNHAHQDSSGEEFWMNSIIHTAVNPPDLPWQPVLSANSLLKETQQEPIVLR